MRHIKYIEDCSVRKFYVKLVRYKIYRKGTSKSNEHFCSRGCEQGKPKTRMGIQLVYIFAGIRDLPLADYIA